MLIKILIVLILLAVLVSLFSGLFFLHQDRGQGARTVRALTTRVALSLVLFGLLVLAFHLGWLTPGK